MELEPEIVGRDWGAGSEGNSRGDAFVLEKRRPRAADAGHEAKVARSLLDLGEAAHLLIIRGEPRLLPQWRPHFELEVDLVEIGERDFPLVPQ